MKWISDYSSPEVTHMKSMISIRLGHNLERILRARGLSLKKLSGKTGIPYSTLHTWSENRQPKDILKVKVLANFLGLSVDSLLFGEDEKPPRAVELPSHASDLVGTYEVVVRRKG